MAIPVPEQFPKRCNTCQRLHTKEAWEALPLPDNGRGETVDGWERLQWRNCTCHSTLVIQLEIFKLDP